MTVYPGNNRTPEKAEADENLAEGIRNELLDYFIENRLPDTIPREPDSEGGDSRSDIRRMREETEKKHRFR